MWSLLRVIKETVKENYKIELTPSHPIMTWATKHAAWLQNRFQLHADGKTSYCRRWERDYIKPLVSFGETIVFKMNHTNGGKTDTKWD